jgi:subtilisin family serine protease
MGSRSGVDALRLAAAALIAFLSTPAPRAQAATNRYALIMEDPSASARYVSRTNLLSVSAESYHRQIEAKQQTLRRELASRNILVTGAAQTLVNAVFVSASGDREAELNALPGVKAVIPIRRYRLKLNRATQLVNAPSAWSALGGQGNAGTGIKIAILDTGIDQTHPAFQDSALVTPAGFPICNGSDCNFTNNKVIVARSYVRQLAAGSSPNPAADSRPDDFSPRDRIGHGTAVASCAAGFATNAPLPVVGVAPKAYLGNYKIFGSPGWNDFASDDVIIQALEDALHDGMDIASLSIGGSAMSGPLDTGAKCNRPAGAPCDVLAYAVENAVNAGMTVVAAAGNEGQDGSSSPTFNTISSPADAPDVIAVGATTNSHVFVQSVRVPGDGVSSNLQQIAAQFGDGFTPEGPVTAPLRDVTALGNDGLACTALPAGSLTGAFALIQRGSCFFLDKVQFARAAGAVGVVFYMADQAPTLSPGGLSGTGIPAAMISNSDGLALKGFISSSPDHLVTLDPTAFEQNTATADLLAGFSSLGPSTGDVAVKPDLLAVGTNMFVAAQSYDVLGGLYSANGYTVANGTSFATPLVAGAAALVKQAHPAFTPAQIRSALVNTASPEVVSDDAGEPVSVQSIGAGKLNAGAAVQSSLTSSPATLSFGVLTSSTLPQTKQLQLTNAGAAPANLTLGVSIANGAPGVTAALDRQTLTLAAGASQPVSVTLSGAVPPP